MRRPLLALALALAPGAARAQTVICVDAGHGGADSGGTGTGMEEKVIVLDTVLRFRDLLLADTADTSAGGTWEVITTRDDDTYVSLSGRAGYANDRGADRFMSIHSNAYDDPSANGTETFSESDSGTGAQLRNLVQEEMLAAWGLRDRGVKTANFAVLTQTAMPSELHELAFITNASDASLLASPEQRQAAARAHLRALQRHYALSVSDPDPDTMGGETGRIIGTVVDEHGVVGGAIVTVDGQRSFTTGPDGDFSFDDVTAGAHTVEASAAGHAPRSSPVTVLAGQTLSVDITLPTGDGETPDPDGDPPGGGSGTAGCGCHAGGRPMPAGLLLAVAVLLAIAAAIARAARRPRARCR